MTVTVMIHDHEGTCAQESDDGDGDVALMATKPMMKRRTLHVIRSQSQTLTLAGLPVPPALLQSQEPEAGPEIAM